jgi:hypothetical protein
VDRIPPVISLKGNPSVGLCTWDVYRDVGYYLKDNYDSVKYIKISTEGTYHNSDTEGLYYFAYIATDRSGNISKSNRRYIYVSCTACIEGCVVGIQDAKKPNINVLAYPNPTSNIVCIEGLGDEPNITITVLDEMGHQINLSTNHIADKIMVPVVQLQNGTYLMRIQTKSTIILKKIEVLR